MTSIAQQHPMYHPMYRYAGASIVGNHHIFGHGDFIRAQNGGDGWHIQPSADGRAIIAVVCDGCGSAPHSEVGALRYPRIIAQAVLKHYALTASFGAGGDFCSADESRRCIFWETVRQSILAKLKCEALSLGGDGVAPDQAIKEYLLFTTLGSLLTPDGACVFGIGDGVFVVNDEVTVIDAGEDNAPPYIAYGLFESDNPDQFRFTTHCNFGPGELQYVLLASDGAEPFVKAPEVLIPFTLNYSTPQRIGNLAQFRQDPAFLNSRFRLQNFLAMVNTPAVNVRTIGDKSTGSLIYGPLEDDTTICHIGLNPHGDEKL